MCFSAEASFGLGAALVGAGVYGVGASRRATRRYLPLAVMPALFGVQQLSEGVVWVGLGRDEPTLTRAAALVYLFFALAFWPFWLCLCAAWVERVGPRRRLWWAVTALATGWGVFLYLPILRDPDRYLAVEIMHHSLRYDYSGVPLVEWIPPLPLRVLYVATCGVPLGGCTDGLIRRFGALLGLAAVFSQLVFWYAFASVWCFFASGLAVYLFWAIPRAAGARKDIPTAPVNEPLPPVPSPPAHSR